SALGAIGFASAAAEIADQTAAMDFHPGAIVHASGSGGTQAGLVLGASLALPKTHVVGIHVGGEREAVRRRVADCAEPAARLLDLSLTPQAIEVVSGPSGYGVVDAATRDALQLAASLEGLPLDPVYTAKALAGLIGLIRAGRWRANEHVV